MSQKAAQDENIKYYYRNYTHSSCRKDFISVSHFPNTVFRCYNLENELYDFNTNKIIFILNGKVQEKIFNQKVDTYSEKYDREDINKVLMKIKRLEDK